MPYKYIGRTTDFCGKTLWEIVGNLKNFGVGRLVVRSAFEKYPEKSFMKIVNVTALPNPKNPSMDDVRKVRVHVERTFRGVKAPKPVNIESTSYKTDYKLIPKHEEHLYLNSAVKKEEVILPKYVEYPPLLKEYVLRESQSPRTKSQDLKLELVYNKQKRIAQDGEKPTFDMSHTLNTKYAPELYKDIH